jgi:dienelactone hydrolase
MSARFTPLYACLVALALSLTSTAAAESVESLLDVPEWEQVTPLSDGKHYLAAIARGGVTQLVLGEYGATTEPRPLTHDSDGIQGYALAADEHSALVSIDAGHRNHARYWRVPLDGSQAVALTPPAELMRLLPFAPSARPQLMVYETRRHDDPGIFLYTQRLDQAAAPTLAFHDAKLNGWMRDVSRDGRRALVLQFLSLSERALVAVDLESGHTERLWPAAGTHANITSARFSPDGRRVFLASDDGQHALLLALDAQTGRELGRHVDRGSELDDIVVSPDGQVVAASALVGVRTELRLLASATLAPLATQPALPLGIGGPTAFTPDGKALAVSWTTPNRPARAYLVALPAGTTTLLGPDANSKSSLVATSEDVPARDGLNIPTLIYRPIAAKGRLPVIVFLHGGPTGAALAQYDWRWSWLTSHGYAVVAPNIRGSSGFGRNFAIADDGPLRAHSFDDIADVARWLGKQPWANAHKLVVYGQSYGGYLVLVALTMQPELWRAGIDAYGIADWRTFLASTNVATRAMFTQEIGSPEHDGAFLDAISPLGHVDRARAPLFVYHGVNDGQVPVAQSDAIVSAWHARKLRVELLRADGEEHGMAQPATRAQFATRLLDFLHEALRE